MNRASVASMSWRRPASQEARSSAEAGIGSVNQARTSSSTGVRVAGNVSGSYKVHPQERLVID